MLFMILCAFILLLVVCSCVSQVGYGCMLSRRRPYSAARPEPVDPEIERSDSLASVFMPINDKSVANKPPGPAASSLADKSTGSKPSEP